MPKIIDGARESILGCAEHILLQEGYAALTLREVAARCSMAVGTIYNYFSSKNVLIASIMVRDWFAALEGADADIAASEDFETGLRALYDRVGEFSARYEPVWHSFDSTADEPGITPERHLLLRGQLEQRLRRLLERFAVCEYESQLSLFAETLLAAVLQKDIDFSALAEASVRLFVAGTKK